MIKRIPTTDTAIASNRNAKNKPIIFKLNTVGIIFPEPTNATNILNAPNVNKIIPEVRISFFVINLHSLIYFYY